MKLLEKIARGWSNYDCAFPAVNRVKREIENGVTRSFAVDCTNIWKWCQKLEAKTKHLAEMIPLCRLPFAEMWMEYEGHYGILFGCLAIEDANNQRIIFNIFASEEKNATLMGLGELGYDDNSGPTKFGISVPPGMEKDKENYSLMVRSVCFPFLYAVSFFHCKNIQTTPITRPRKLQHAIDKRSNFHVPTFHIIEVHKYMERNEIEYEENKNPSSAHRAHIVRGHFKRYTEEAPLMGKHSGVYFWQQHVAGAGPVGINEYRVHPPTGRHTKKCIIQ
jgi:hypothetical protein